MYKNNSNPFGGYGFDEPSYVIGSEDKEVITGYKDTRYWKKGDHSVIKTKAEYEALPEANPTSEEDNKGNYELINRTISVEKFNTLPETGDDNSEYGNKENYTAIKEIVVDPNKYDPKYQGFQNPLAKDNKNFVTIPEADNFGKTQQEVFLSNGSNQIYPNMAGYSVFLWK